MSDVKAGIYHGCRGVVGSEQYASKNDKDQIAVDVFVPELERSFTTILYFSDAAAPYAIERLRALGWQGDDLSKLVGIDSKDVDVLLKYETFEGKDRLKVEIVTGGGGRVKLDNPMDEKQKRAFAARMKAVIGGNGGSPKPTPKGQQSTKREGAYDPGPEGETGGGSDEIPF